jgi:polyphenol oxidase
LGGLSVSPYDSLNLGFSSGDDLDTIKQNRKIFFDSLGISEDHLAWSKLVHGNKVLVARGPVKGEGCDAVITNVPGVFCSVSIADCTPVLIYDKTSKAVAAIHAGWRSTASEIVMETINAMKDNYGTKGEDCLAFIGACISEVAFEVGEEVAEQFDSDVKYFNSIKQKFFVDLKKENKKQLMQMGVKENNIEISPYCTVINNDKFFSYRKEKGKTGRMLALIGVASASSATI